ncbi:MAG TPA: YkgJ family cysteine cluster protein [Polyangiales bacterium]
MANTDLTGGGKSRSGRSAVSKRPAKTKASRTPRAGAASAPAALAAPARPLIPCTACGLCCSYVAIEIDAPTTARRATQLLFYLYHEGVSLYASGDDWMVQFESRCKHLLPDRRCGVYETRPHICRDFSETDCEVNSDDDEGHTFYTTEALMAYLQIHYKRAHRELMKGYAPPPTAAKAKPRLPLFEQRFRDVRGVV